ncbi:neprosin family prolyl endopeptidase [Streptomyces sp. MCAF7]
MNDGVLPAITNGLCHWHPTAGAKPAPNSKDTPEGSRAEFAIQLGDRGEWNIKYRGKTLGYFDSSLWGRGRNRFRSGTSAQWYGEVLTADKSGDCTEMGNGQPGSSSTAPAPSGGRFTK